MPPTSTEISYPVAAGLAPSWWVFLLRGGLAFTLIGVMAVRKPAWTLSVLVLAFAVYAIFEGVSALFAAIRGWSYSRDRWLLVLEAVVGIGVGIVTLHRPGITALVLIDFIAVWALATGILKIVEAVNLGEGFGRGWLAVGGVASIVFALLVLFRPPTGELVMVTVIGIYALILGVTEIVLGFNLRGIRDLERSGARRSANPRAA